MRREIGSEFWSVPTAGENRLFPEDTHWFRSGRSALEAIIRENHFRTAALPAWCCDSMIQPFVEAEIAVSFYEPGQPPAAADAALVMDYFGYTGHSPRGDFRGTVIRDVTHSLLSADYSDADYYFGSLRKWAGFTGGGFARGFREPVSYCADSSGYEALRQQAMAEKADYISGTTDDKGYLKTFAEAEELLETGGIFPGTQQDARLARLLDVDFIFRRRRANAAILLETVGELAVFPEIKDTDCPMFVPILTDRRDDLRRYLIQNEIYCPVHWPVSPLHSLTEKELVFYGRELSLVCDQRYTEADMRRFAELIRKFYAEGA